MEDYKKLLTDLYAQHDPERASQIDYFLEKYKGKEKQFYISQQTKYKSKKPISDSKKIIEEALTRIKSQSSNPPENITNQEIVAPQEDINTLSDIEKKVVTDYQKKKEAVDSGLVTPVIPPEDKPKAPKAKIDFKKESSAPPKSKQGGAWFNERRKDSVPPIREIPKTPTRDEDKHFNQKYFLYIFGIVLLAIILTVIAFFIFFYKPHTANRITNNKPKTTIEKNLTKKETKKPESTTAKPAIKSEAKKTTVKPKAKTTAKTTVNTTANATPTHKQEPKATPQKQEVTKAIVGSRIVKEGIQLPAYFVACYAVKTENHAIKKAAELKAKGFAASYYWIPDFVRGGNTYFKVVVGPFATRKEAMLKLTPVQEKAEFDAYVLDLK